jgi:hypothetical protein
MKPKTVYFDQASSEHTNNVISIVTKFLETAPDVHYVVAATTRGETGLIAAKAFQKKKVIVVTHMSGFVKPNVNELSHEKREEIKKLGAEVLTATHALAGIGRGIRKNLGTYTLTELIAYAYRTFGQGTKVCAEIALMVADAGLVPIDKDVICIGGTGRGADTAWLVQPAYTSDFPNLKMKACLCKPLEF